MRTAASRSAWMRSGSLWGRLAENEVVIHGANRQGAYISTASIARSQSPAHIALWRQGEPEAVPVPRLVGRLSKVDFRPWASLFEPLNRIPLEIATPQGNRPEKIHESYIRSTPVSDPGRGPNRACCCDINGSGEDMLCCVLPPCNPRSCDSPDTALLIRETRFVPGDRLCSTGIVGTDARSKC